MREILSQMESPTDGEPQWVDLAFELTALSQLSAPSRLTIEARGQLELQVAGFGFEIECTGWRRDQHSQEIWFDWGRGALLSLGAESDNFADLLSKLMGDGSRARFADRVACDVVLLNSEPDRLMTEPCQSKFFIGPADESEAQVFINFDVPEKACEFREKDLEFRPNLLRHLVVH